MTSTWPAYRVRWIKPLAVLLTLAMAYAIPYGAAYGGDGISRLFGLRADDVPLLPWLYLHHALQLLLALAAIAIVRRFVPADYGLHWPKSRTYIGSAICWGIAFGVIMTVVDYAPELIARHAPDLGYRLTGGKVAGWLFFEGVYVGPTEEIPFRALLVTFLAAILQTQLRVGRFTMSWAGVIVALFFALLHAQNFYSRPWPLALGQQVYAFLLGVLYAYWLEKSRSVVAPSVGHNVSDVVEYALAFLWVGLLGPP